MNAHARSMLVAMAAAILGGFGCGGGAPEAATTPAHTEPAAGTGSAAATEPAASGEPAAPAGPSAADQIAAGQTVWRASCENCHKYGSKGRELVGPFDRSGAKTAADLVAFIKEKMPKDDPGSLSDEQAWAVVAAILSKRGELAADAAALTPENASALSLE